MKLLVAAAGFARQAKPRSQDAGSRRTRFAGKAELQRLSYSPDLTVRRLVVSGRYAEAAAGWLVTT